MATFIGDISALQFLLTANTSSRHVLGAANFQVLRPTRSAPQRNSKVNLSLIKKLGIPNGIYTNKLHINVADGASRCRSKLVVSHIWPTPSRGSYLRIDNEYCVLTPEACFVQMASHLPLSHLTELAMMLCGTYVPTVNEYLPACYDVAPLTTPKKLQAYTKKLSNKKGLHNACIAASLAASGAGSPMEGKIAAMFALSTRQGGMGLPALLNWEVPLTEKARGLGYRSIRRPDFLWKKYGVAMDYDSKEYHDNKIRFAADESRRNELGAMGLTSVVARSHHFRSYLEFDALTGQVLAAMRRNRESTVGNLPKKRMQLFDELFGAKQWDPFAQ